MAESPAKMLRKEDPALLSGRGRYADDLPVPVGTLHAHVVRSPHAHADIVAIDASAALKHDGVWAVITGEDVRKLSEPFLAAVKTPVQQWALAVERVRYVGEPVALVVAESRYIAEDAAELVNIEYAPLEAVLDPRAACEKAAPLLHPQAETNEVSVRKFSYGDADAAFAHADRRIAMTTEFPRLSFTPIECYVVVAEHNPAEGSYDVLANFQGPFSMHPVMARALRVAGPKLRLRIPPDSGGSFGIKLSVFPYVVLIALAAKIAGRPVKWVEDRIEHLVAASSGPNRVTEIEAAITKDGRILGLKLDQLEDYGAFLRAPMPGPLYRMHGAVTGAYDIANVEVTNRVVLTNKMPSSLIRGFGGPQLYLALERLMQRIAVELNLDPLDVIRRNLIPAEKFPYRAAAGALYDSGDYLRAVEKALGGGRLDALKRRRDEARAAGRRYGIGFAAIVEPAMSNMGYLSTLMTAQAREKAGPKNGAVSMARVNIDPLGAVSVTADVTVQGQSHETVLAEIVARELGLRSDDIEVVLEIDTAKDQWSIAAGTYSSRFASGTAVAAHMAAAQMRDKLKAIAAKQLNVLPDDVELAGGKIRSRSNPDNALPFGRVAATSHWSPAMLPETMAPALSETGIWSPPRARAAVERRPHQHLADLRFRLRHVRRRDRSEDLSGPRRPLCVDARCRPHPQSDHRRGPDPRRLRPRHCRRALRGVHLQRRRRIPERHLCRLSGADRERNPRRRDFALFVAVAVHAARRQGVGRGQLHEHAGLHRQRHRRCAGRRGGGVAGNAAAHPRHIGGRQTMKPRPFDYVRPDTVEEALALLAEYGDDARILAGGQSLVPMLNLRLIDAGVLIDISRIAALDVIRDLGKTVEIGAAVTQNKLMAWQELGEKLPLLAAALPFVGHFQTRNKGTVCGSIAHADPSSEIPLALAVLGGEVVLRSKKRGARVLAANEFQKDMLTTARDADELIVAVRFPVMAGQGVAFREVARRHGDFAIIAVAAVVDNRGAARLGVGGMAGRPLVRRIFNDPARSGRGLGAGTGGL